MTEAEYWSQRFSIANDRGWVKMELERRFTPFATLFDKQPRTTGKALDLSIVIAEFYQFDDGSIVDSCGGKVIEIISPTLWERTPEDGRKAMSQLRNLGTRRHPLFAEDIISPKDRAMLEASHYWQQATGTAAAATAATSNGTR